MNASTLRFDQIGSLIRPQWLKDIYVQHEQGKARDEDLRAAQNRAVREVIAKQEALDLPVISDGEFHRSNFQDAFRYSVEGFEANPNVINPPPGFRPGAFGKAVAPLRMVRNVVLEEWRFAQEFTDRLVKPTVVSPAQSALRVEFEPGTYGSDREFLEAVVNVQQRVVGELAQAGCKYVQIDAPAYSEYLDEARVAALRERGEDPAANLRRDLECDNAVIAAAGDMITGIHFCRGNFPLGSPLLRRGGYEAIAEQAFNTLRHDRFLLEFDDERSGGFEPLRFVPKGKVVVLGLVTTKTGGLETADTLKRRIEEASRYLPLEQLALSPQCGFATAMGLRGDRMTEEEQWRKLELVRDVAKSLWGEGN